MFWALLELLKPMYGLVDAPLLFQLALLAYILDEMHGIRSLFDDGFIYWPHEEHIGVMYLMLVIYVDDILAAGRLSYRTWAKERLSLRFGAIKSSTMPFTHVGFYFVI